MIFYSNLGILGYLIGWIAGYLSVWLAVLCGVDLSSGWQHAYAAAVAMFVGALFALVTDRSDLPGLFHSYGDNILQSYIGALERSFFSADDTAENDEPHRRLAILIWPLVFGPFIMAIVAAGICRGESRSTSPNAMHEEALAFLYTNVIFAVATTVFAVATKNIRLSHPPAYSPHDSDCSDPTRV